VFGPLARGDYNRGLGTINPVKIHNDCFQLYALNNNMMYTILGLVAN
jgi:hypothetical protein